MKCPGTFDVHRSSLLVEGSLSQTTTSTSTCGRASGGPGHHDRGGAGDSLEIRRNTIRGDQSYGFLGHLNRPAVELRGTPDRIAIFAENAVAHEDEGSAPAQQPSDVEPRRALVADFDGDGRTDIARSNGGRWQVSPGGASPWQTLRSSSDSTVGTCSATSTAKGKHGVLRLTQTTSRTPVLRFISFNRFQLSNGNTTAPIDARFTIGQGSLAAPRPVSRVRDQPGCDRLGRDVPEGGVQVPVRLDQR